MIDRGKYNVLGVMVNAIDYEAASQKIIDAALERRSFSVTALAVHGVMTGVMDLEQRYRLNHLDLVVPDGQPVRWALNMLYQTALPDRVYGPHLVNLICQQAAERQLPIFLYGSHVDILQRLVSNLEQRYPGLQIAGKLPSVFRKLTVDEMQTIVQKIQNSGAALVLVGLGCPRQEVWVYEYQEQLNMPLLAVGAAFSFHAGVLKQPPTWLQNWGLEWFFRLVQEPRRLWRRYLLLNPVYLFLLALQFFRLHIPRPEAAIKPDTKIHYG